MTHKLLASVALTVIGLLLTACLASLPPTASPTPTSTSTMAPSLTPTTRPSETPTPTSVRAPTSTRLPTYTAVPTLAPNRVVTKSPDLLQYCKDDGSSPMHSYIRARRVGWRWPILSPCEIVSGVIVEGPKLNTGDGDYVFNLRLDPGQENFLDEGDKKTWGGTIHCEIDPQDQDYLGIPENGRHVVLVGAWVHDPSDEGQVGWNEIHPVMYWAYLP